MEVIGSLAKKFTMRIALKTKVGRKHEELTEEQIGKNIGKNNELADIFSDYFSSIYKDKDTEYRDNSKLFVSKSLQSHANHPSIKKIQAFSSTEQGSSFTDTFSFEDTNYEEVRIELSNLRTSCSSGWDEIPAKIIQSSKECIPYLVQIFNACKNGGSFPTELKMADIVPVPKKGDLNLKSNYRQVSILPVVSKVFERIMLKQINKYMDNKLSPILGGYKKDYSCQHSLLRLIEKWKTCLDNKGIIGTVLIDLSKAFDLIDHNLLIAKLSAYGFDILSLNFLASYLCGRKQRIKLNGIFSVWEDILSGVPQGSILGPILFNIFINDLFLFIESCDVCNYVDDNTLSALKDNYDEVKKELDIDLRNVKNWFTDNCMIMNEGKCHVMFLSKHVTYPKEFVVNYIELQVEDYVELLGVIIDKNLNFSRHLEKLCKSAKFKLMTLKRLRPFISEKKALLLAKTFICSQFNYCPLIWTIFYAKNIYSCSGYL